MTALATILSDAFPGMVTEYRFHPTRLWRFDFAWPDKKVAVEYEGGVYQRGSHQHLDRYTSDCQKYNAAQLLGWIVLRYTAADNYEDIVAQVKQALGGRDEHV